MPCFEHAVPFGGGGLSYSQDLSLEDYGRVLVIKDHLVSPQMHAASRVERLRSFMTDFMICPAQCPPNPLQPHVTVSVQRRCATSRLDDVPEISSRTLIPVVDRPQKPACRLVTPLTGRWLAMTPCATRSSPFCLGLVAIIRSRVEFPVDEYVFQILQVPPRPQPHVSQPCRWVNVAAPGSITNQPPHRAHKTRRRASPHRLQHLYLPRQSRFPRGLGMNTRDHSQISDLLLL